MDEHTPANEPWEELPPPGRRSTRGWLAWDGGRALLFFIFAALVSILIGLILQEAIGFYISVLAAELIAFWLIPYALSFLFDTGWLGWTANPRVSLSFWIWSSVAVIAFAVAQSNLPVLFDRLYPIGGEQLALFREYLTAESYLDWLVVLLVGAVVPSVCEEVAFRGVIQTGLRNSYGPRQAIIWSGFLFALLHLNPWNFIGLWCFGCLLGYLTEQTQSIRPAIIMHLLNNAFALVVFSVQGGERWEQRPEFIPWYYTLVAGGVLVYALVRVHRLTRKSSPDHTNSEVPPRSNGE